MEKNGIEIKSNVQNFKDYYEIIILIIQAIYYTFIVLIVNLYEFIYRKIYKRENK